MKEEKETLRNQLWSFRRNDDGTVTLDRVQAALLQDIREELKDLNQLLNCENFLRIPMRLSQIAGNTAPPKPFRKPKRKRKAK